MNTHQWYLNGLRKVGAANTFIGGVASVINTPALLAAKFLLYPSGAAFPVANIQNFTIVGDDIECYIGVDYQITSFAEKSLITYYYDDGNFCKDISGSSVFRGATNLLEVKLEGIVKLSGLYIFRDCSKLKKLSFPNCLAVGNYAFYHDGNENNFFYLPKCVNYGSTVGDNQAIYLIKSNSIIYAHPSMQTINDGAEEGDLAYARNTRGATIRYVTNFTPPNPITNLSIGNIYGTALQLNFSAPTGNTNAIDFYEVYSGNKYLGKVTASGQHITGLTPNTVYNIEVKPVDIYYNKSTSNIVTQSTSNGVITDLSIGNIYGTALQLNFTAPTDVYNPNGKYRCYADGVYKNTTDLNGYITGLSLNTSYNITVIAEDGLNSIGGLVSNIVTQTTGATYVIPTADLVSYYKMEGNVLDSWGSNHGTATAITYASGLVGQTAVFNGTTSFINLNSSSIIGGKSAFSLVTVFKHSGATMNVLYGSWISPLSIIVRINSGNLQFYTYTANGQVGGTFTAFTDTASYHKLVCTYDGAIMKMYLDNVLLGTTYAQIGTINRGGETEKIGKERGSLASGQIDETAVFNKALSAAEVSDINAKLLAGQSLI